MFIITFSFQIQKEVWDNVFVSAYLGDQGSYAYYDGQYLWKRQLYISPFGMIRDQMDGDLELSESYK